MAKHILIAYLITSESNVWERTVILRMKIPFLQGWQQEESSQQLRGFGLQPRSRRDLRSSGILRSISW